MAPRFKKISPEAIKENPFKLIDDDWMLITPGTMASFNTMTASWGGLGIIWHKAVAFCFIRPQRHTFQFMEKAQFYTLCFFEDEHRPILDYCGSHSGTDVDKIKETGLQPVGGETGAVYFKQAKLVLECRKIYFQDLNPANFLDPEIQVNYPTSDYHRMYVGEIVNCLAK